MPAAAALRLQIEHALASRFPSALTPAPCALREVAATGIEEADRLLDGGLPVGAISEITGPASSGRTSLALSFLARRTAEARVCAWVDTNDAFDPESAAANGVDLRQMLWVRCQERRQPQPRAGRAPQSEKAKPWTKLDQALRATDLLLQAAGFAAIVLDLGDTAPEHGNRIPLASWFRFRQAADRTRCSLVVLGQAAYAQSSAAVALECSPLEAETAGDTVLRGFTFRLLRGRQRFTSISPAPRRPPVSTWSAHSTWDTEKRA
ncbi:MAG TPA: ATPase domain-containing protein [Terracidiphilus sp.]